MFLSLFYIATERSRDILMILRRRKGQTITICKTPNVYGNDTAVCLCSKLNCSQSSSTNGKCPVIPKLRYFFFIQSWVIYGQTELLLWFNSHLQVGFLEEKQQKCSEQSESFQEREARDIFSQVFSFLHSFCWLCVSLFQIWQKYGKQSSQPC